MPYEKVVTERETYWCPKWYWPFAVCTRTRRVHKWCYQFRWYKETGFGFVKMYEGCEGQTLYRWWGGCFLCFGSMTWQDPTLASFELCFDSPRPNVGTCAG